MKTHKNNFPDFQQIKTFFQSFFKKPIFVLKKIISLQVIDKSSDLCVLVYKSSTNLKLTGISFMLTERGLILISQFGSRRTL